jgi:hypothetical protein
MKINISLSEYENDPDGTIIVLNTSLPDGSAHQDVTAVFNRALSALYGYNIGGNYFDDAPDNS